MRVGIVMSIKQIASSKKSSLYSLYAISYTSEGDFRIDGTLEGNIKTKGRVIIGVEGSVKGKINAVNSDIEGKFSGDLFVQETLTIKATANISGDVIIGKLSVEPGATFNASCSMKGAIKELNQNEQQQLSEKTA